MSLKPATQILRQAANDSQANEQLFALVYDELKKMAEQKMRHEQVGHTLQPTALVHEVFLRLVDVDPPPKWENRRHFYGAAAKAMRRILVDNARRRLADKRGGKLQRERFSESGISSQQESEQDWIDLDQAIEDLEKHDAELAELVKLKCFGGLTVDQIAEAIGGSPRTVKRKWAYARAWLRTEIDNQNG